MPERDVVKLHQQLVRIPSLSKDEAEVADALESFFRYSEVETSRIGNNVIASIGDGPHTLLLNTHLDTVPPSRSHPHGPYAAEIHDGRVWGRGAVDAKASLASMSFTLARLAREGWQPGGGRVLGAFTACEETGGTDNGLEEVLPSLGSIHGALIGEPTEMHPCVAQKGLLILRLEAKGVSAHAARPAGGHNAIHQAARDILALNKLVFERTHPALGDVTLQVTTIEGGTARNVIPDRCVLFVDIRSTPAYEHEEMVEIVRTVVGSEVHVHSDRFVPVATDPTETIVRTCLAANPEGIPFGSPTMSDWIYLKGVPTVKIGPGNSALSHTADEHVSIHELERATAIYRDIILRYFEPAQNG